MKNQWFLNFHFKKWWCKTKSWLSQPEVMLLSFCIGKTHSLPCFVVLNIKLVYGLHFCLFWGPRKGDDFDNRNAQNGQIIEVD